jgi:hypothetical protein
MAGETLPANAGSLIRGEEWGIDNTLTGFIIQSEDINEEVITDTTQDQKGAVVSQLDYDKHWTLTLNVIGDTTTAPVIGSGTAADVGDTTFTYGGHKWKVNSVQYTGSYQDKKKWVINAERWANFPAQS